LSAAPSDAPREPSQLHVTDSSTIEAVFTGIYKRREWGGDESVSGPGSGLVRTASLRQDLVDLLIRLRAQSVLDAGCGDFHWMKEAALGRTRYLGLDVVRALVEANRAAFAAPGRDFLHGDFVRDPLPSVDVIVCRDVLPHLSCGDIRAAIENFNRSGSRWLLTNTFVARRANPDIETGGWRPLNLQAPPFELPPPSFIIDERCEHSGGIWSDKRLALWPLPVTMPPSAGNV
jgi:SAM-dependent methyltransferase